MTNSLSYINRTWLEQEARKSFENHFPQYIGTSNYGKYFDSYRHTYVSALLVREFGSTIADMMGIVNEILGVRNTMPDHNQDLWNNRVGRNLAENNPNLTDSQLAALVADAINNGDCITDKNNDPRISDIVPEYPLTEAVFAVVEFVGNLLEDLLSSARTIGSFAQSFLNSINGAESTFPIIRRSDPLSFDLDNDGIELVALKDSNVFFDLDEDGFRENVGWVKADDGILTLDNNNNGNIDNIDELFGSSTQLGTTELAGYDDNLDGKIDKNDAVFAKLKLWQDLNQDGISQSGELKSLSQYNITSIDVNPANIINKNQIIDGNQIISTSTYQTSKDITVAIYRDRTELVIEDGAEIVMG